MLNAPGFSAYFPLLPLALLSSSIGGVMASWLSRKYEFGTIAKGNIYSSITGKGVSLGYGIVSPSPFGLILGTIINDATIVVVLLRKTLGDIHFFRCVSYERIKQLALRYKKFPQFQLGADLAGTASTAAPPLLLAVFFTPFVIGWYAMSYMVMRVPTKLLGSALFQVFYQKACDEKNQTGNIKNIVETIHTRLISAGMIVCLIVMILGPELFEFVLGMQWTEAGVYAQIIAPWMFIAFISIPLLTIFYIMEKQAADFWFSVLQLVSKAIAVFIGGLFADPILAMVLLSISGVSLGMYVNIYTLKIAGVSVIDTILEIIRYSVLSLLFCLPLIIAKFYALSTVILISIAIIISVVYYSVLIYRDSQLKKGLINFVKSFYQKFD
jgi:O-antigen/teichoic acid export membrane protein